MSDNNYCNLYDCLYNAKDIGFEATEMPIYRGKKYVRFPMS